MVKVEYKGAKSEEIANDWDIKELKELVQICYGKSQKEVEVKNGKYKILGTGGEIGRTNDYLWDKPSVLIGRKGTIDKPMYTDEPFWTVDTLFYTKIKEIVNPKWLFYYLNNIDLKKYNEATGVPSLSVSNLNKIKIITPKLQEQQKIASILSTVDEQIENTEKLIEKTKELKKGLMQNLLTKGTEGQWRIENLEWKIKREMKKTLIGEIPIKWEVKKIKDICSVKRGASPRPISDKKWFSEDSKVGWVRISDVTNTKKYLYKTTQFLSLEGIKKSRRVSKGDLIMSICATVGKPIILNMDACIHDGFVVLDEMDRNAIDIEYLYYLLSKQEDKFKSKGQTGTQSNLNTNIVGLTLIQIPPLKEQQQITSILSSVDEKIDSYENKKEKLSKLKKGLMQQLLTGKIRVKV